MAKYQSRADLLIAAGESIKMQEKAGILPTCKIGGDVYLIFGKPLEDYTVYEFPLAVVEGKPVFVGDELYNTNTGNKLSIHPKWTTCWDSLSWNQPKPATVMVELLREDAEILASCAFVSPKSLKEACRKALEKA